MTIYCSIPNNGESNNAHQAAFISWVNAKMITKLNNEPGAPETYTSPKIFPLCPDAAIIIHPARVTNKYKPG